MSESSNGSMVGQTMKRQGTIAAIYARVSSDRQRREQTIQSQTAALRELAAGRELLVPEDLVFEDEGVSGAVLRRPALERLRDLAVEGRFEVLLCHAPDRLARRYAYQVLLLEEFQRAGIEVIFAKEPERSGTPEDELLRQFQGMIAEYERAQIAERCRRGKLHRARAGAVSVLARAPYGYRYVKKSEHADAFYVIDESEAAVVREVFRRYAEDGESIGRIARWLSAQGVPTRTGTTGWNNATVWGMLRNPAYAGQAAYGKTHATGAPVRETRHARQRGQRSARISRERVAPDQWKQIAVPALVTEEQFAMVGDRLHRNKRLSPRNTRRPSLLQGILVCRECGYAYYRCSTRSPNGILREYYRCSGTDGHRRPEGRVCDNRPVRLAEIDELVWTRVLGLLDDPTLIQTEIDRRLQTLRAAHPATALRDALERDLTRAQHALRRLIDGYQEQLVTLEELRARTPELRKREATLRAQLDALDAELHDAETYLKLTETLEGFRARLSKGAGNLTVEQRQQIIRLVVREVLIGEDDVTIRTPSRPRQAISHPVTYCVWVVEKTQIQARQRTYPTAAPATGQGQRVEHDYDRGGALCYLAAWDVHRGQLTARCEQQTGIAPFGRLVEQVMTREPYANAKRVFWIVDNSTSHRGQPSIDRLQTEWPNLVLVHLPFHASWLNQIEIIFSVVQRKVLTPNDFASLQALVDRLDAFEHYYNQIASPFQWSFTRDNLEALITRVAQHEPLLRRAA